MSWPAPDTRPAPDADDEQAVFDGEVAEHDRRERRMLWKEVASIAFVTVVVIIRQRWLT